MEKVCAELCDQVMYLLQGRWNPSWPLEQKQALQTCLERDFPPCDFVCDASGSLIHMDGSYSLKKHKQAWDRSLKWMCYWKNNDLIWISKKRKPFKRLINTAKRLKTFRNDNTLSFSTRLDQEQPWKGGLPPICLGMIGTMSGKRAVVVDKIEQRKQKQTLIGIGDTDCLFKDFHSRNQVRNFGLQIVDTVSYSWVVETGDQTYKIPLQSSRFKRSRNVIKDIKANKKRMVKYICDTITIQKTYQPAQMLTSPKQADCICKKKPLSCPVFVCEHVRKKTKY